MNNHNSHQTFEPFLANYTQGQNQICFRVMLADTQTAVAAMLKLWELFFAKIAKYNENRVFFQKRDIHFSRTGSQDGLFPER